jgi:hypothetical protein
MVNHYVEKPMIKILKRELHIAHGASSTLARHLFHHALHLRKLAHKLVYILHSYARSHCNALSAACI